MKEGGRSVSAGRDRLRRALVVIEFALALTLLAGGGMAVHALVTMMRVDLGFRAERLVTFDLPVARGKLADERPDGSVLPHPAGTGAGRAGRGHRCRCPRRSPSRAATSAPAGRSKADRPSAPAAAGRSTW